jgi:hypothetical protein
MAHLQVGEKGSSTGSRRTPAKSEIADLSPAKGGSAPAKPAGRWSRPDIKHTSVYLPEAAYEALRQVAFDERRKIHDLLIEGVELALKKRGYPALADMKAKWQRKER